MRHAEIVGDDGTVTVDQIPTGYSIDVHATSAGGAAALLRAASDRIAAAGGGLARLWVRGEDPVLSHVAEQAGFARERSLHQLRVALPLPQPWSLEVRPFVVGQDDEAWLGVNNRAFSWHPEQGGWTQEDLDERIAEPWFDPDGFLVHEQGGTMLGFCWTKEHRDEEPPLGEIYVIAVDPDAEVRGLGTPLTLAGLDHLARRGLRVGMLYVDGENERALRMYERLGFTVHSTDTAWTRQVAPA